MDANRRNPWKWAFLVTIALVLAGLAAAAAWTWAVPHVDRDHLTRREELFLARVLHDARSAGLSESACDRLARIVRAKPYARSKRPREWPAQIGNALLITLYLLDEDKDNKISGSCRILLIDTLRQVEP